MNDNSTKGKEIYFDELQLLRKSISELTNIFEN